jgi:hypothetical protein
MLNNPGLTNLASVSFTQCTTEVDNFTSGTALTLLAANENRTYAIFQNIGDNGDITLFLGDATEEGGIVLNPGGSYEINQNNLYVGKVMGISSITNARISFTNCTK